MRKRLSNDEMAGSMNILAFLAFTALAYFAYSKGRHVIGSCAAFLSVWALLMTIQIFIAKTAYLEGHVVRLIRKNHGKMKKAEILDHYAHYGSFDFVLDTLKKRKAVEQEGETILLLEENIKHGFRNRLMMWGTRRVKL